MKRLLLVLLVAAAASGVASPGAEAGRECDGLLVCIPVAGPWVAVNGGPTPTYYQLSCPGRGQVIGGLDADRAGPLEITFLGSLGGPISPGVTTQRDAVFVARTTRALSGFRPLLGCIPAGGGGGRGQTSYEPKRKLTAAAPPVIDATIRRVKNVRLKDQQTERLSHSLPRGRAAARVLDGRRPAHAPAAVARRARLRPRDRTPRRPRRRRQRPLRDHASGGHAGRGSDPRNLCPGAQLRRAS